MITLTTIARGDASRITDPRRTIVRTSDEWRMLWALHAGPDAAAPAVDFTSTIVAAAFAGEKASAGHSITIADAIADPGGVRLVVEEQAPGAGMLAAQILTSPFHIVGFRRIDGYVRWEGAGGAAAEGALPPHERAPAESRGAAVETTRVEPPAMRTDAEGRPAAAPTATGLNPITASVLAYLAGPISGALMLFAETASTDVRFHAWQSIIALGGLGLALLASYVLAFAALFVSATGVSVMVRVSTTIWLALLFVWAVCLWKALSGERWKLPLAGEFAERLATSARPTPARQAPPTR